MANAEGPAGGARGPATLRVVRACVRACAVAHAPSYRRKHNVREAHCGRASRECTRTRCGCAPSECAAYCARMLARVCACMVVCLCICAFVCACAGVHVFLCECFFCTFCLCLSGVMCACLLPTACVVAGGGCCGGAHEMRDRFTNGLQAAAGGAPVEHDGGDIDLSGTGAQFPVRGLAPACCARTRARARSDARAGDGALHEFCERGARDRCVYGPAFPCR